MASGTETLTIPGVKGVGDGDFVAPKGNVGRPHGNIEGVAFSPDGKCIAACVHGRDNMVNLWDAETGDELLTLNVPIGPRWVAFSPDGTRLGTACLDGSSRVWDVETGQEVLMLSGHAGRVTALGFGPDGRRIFTSSLGPRHRKKLERKSFTALPFETGGVPEVFFHTLEPVAIS